MSNLIPFDFESHPVRIITDDNGEPLFVAKDVAIALGYVRPNDAINQHCKGAVKHRPLQTSGGLQNVRVIHEPDLYRMLAGSTLPSAQRFEIWLFEEVLPSIRKTGEYSMLKPLNYQDDVIALHTLAKAANALAEAALALATKYENHSTVEKPASQTQPSQPKPQPVLLPPREAAFIQGWWHCLGEQTVTASDLYRAIAAKQCQELNDSSGALLGDISQWTPKKLSYALKRWSQLILDHFVVFNVGKTSRGSLWRLEHKG